jgi:hypothetical protein
MEGLDRWLAREGCQKEDKVDGKREKTMRMISGFHI